MMHWISIHPIIMAVLLTPAAFALLLLIARFWLACRQNMEEVE